MSIITQEIVNKLSNCQGCSHEWSEHTNGCSHDFCNCKDKVDSSILEQVMIIKNQKVMIDVFDDFFHIRKEDKSHEYLIQAKFQGNNDHKCDSSHGLVSWKFLGDYNAKIEAVFLCSKCNDTFTVIYDYHDSETYEEIGIKNPFKENEFDDGFYSYTISTDNEGFYVLFFDLDKNEHEICYTKSKKIAEYLENHFDNLAIDEERELFEELTK